MLFHCCVSKYYAKLLGKTYFATQKGNNRHTSGYPEVCCHVIRLTASCACKRPTAGCRLLFFSLFFSFCFPTLLQWPVVCFIYAFQICQHECCPDFSVHSSQWAVLFYTEIQISTLFGNFNSIWCILLYCVSAKIIRIKGFQRKSYKCCQSHKRKWRGTNLCSLFDMLKCTEACISTMHVLCQWCYKSSWFLCHWYT